MVVAIAGFLIVAAGHSILGERGVVRPVLVALEGAPRAPILSALVRVVWHLTSLAWAGFALALVGAGSPELALAAAGVAAGSGLAIFVCSRGRHPAWVIFAGTTLAIAHAQGLPRLATGAGWLAAATLAAIAGLHLAWALGLKWGLEAVLPARVDGTRAIRPGRGLTVLVAGALAAASALAAMNAGLVAGPALARPLGWAAALVFAARGVGDFSLVGLFKKPRDSSFARHDDLVFTPLCFALSACFVLQLAP